MFHRGTLFVVGAGASAEVGLPTGYTLAMEISNKLDCRFDFHEQTSGDAAIVGSLKKNYTDIDLINEILAEGRTFQDGTFVSESVDNFLEIHQSNAHLVRLGKMGIVSAILDCEEKSELNRLNPHISTSYVHPREANLQEIKQSWHLPFSRELVRKVRKESIGSAFPNISIMSFNYDRCVEYYLRFAIARVYSIPLDEAATIVSKNLQIFHPYGSVGTFPTEPGGDGTRFGQSPFECDLFKLADDIFTYSELVADLPTQKAFAEQIRETEVVVFLGFAFHDQNMALLGSYDLPKVREVYASAYRMSEPEHRAAEAAILRALPSVDGSSHVFLANLTAMEFMIQFRTSIVG